DTELVAILKAVLAACRLAAQAVAHLREAVVEAGAEAAVAAGRAVGAAAVDVALAAVLDTVGAGRRGAGAGGAEGAAAVLGDLTVLARVARRAQLAAAVDVGLVLVDDVVAARGERRRSAVLAAGGEHGHEQQKAHASNLPLRQNRAMQAYDGKVVVITGASAGIGAALAEEVARRGGDVVLAARSRDKLSAVAARIAPSGQQALAVPTDL